MKRKHPIGIKSFREIREGGYYYVDKTPHIGQLIQDCKVYFLSRPRRFGKSLLLDTIKELFEGSEELFRGLRIHDAWDWSVRHPVVRLDFGGGGFEDAEGLRTNLGMQLDKLEDGLPTEFRCDTPSGRFGELLETLHEHTGQRVVVLVDEYDKPVLDALAAGDAALAQANRYALKDLYAKIKAWDAHIHFVFLAGVSRFAKVGMYPELNSLLDITLSRKRATLCGFTDVELDTVFAAELDGLDRDAIRDWHGGYHWLGAEKIYNPFEILMLLEERMFRSHWDETGTLAFLRETINERGVFALDTEDIIADDYDLLSYEFDQLCTAALLFQTGYLTIAEEFDHGGLSSYRLACPNRSVRKALENHLLRAPVPAAWPVFAEDADGLAAP